MSKPEVPVYWRCPWEPVCYDCDWRGEARTKREAESMAAKHRRECPAHLACPSCGHMAIRHGQFSGYCEVIDYEDEHDEGCQCTMSISDIEEGAFNESV